MRRIMIALTAACLWPLAAATTAVQDLAGVDLELIEIADSGGYFVYSYELTNPSASTWGLVAVEIQIPASSGTPATLATTGNIVDYTASGGSVDPHAEVGPIVPGGWTTYLDRGARVLWALPTGLRRSLDSLAPGQTRDSLGLRSSYHPGITDVSAYPTMQSCCLVPYDSTPGEELYYEPGSFRVFGTAVAPRYMPEEVDIDLLQTQLTAICDDPLWLDNSQLCTEFDGLLDEAADDYGDSNFYGAMAVLSHLFDRIEEEEEAFDPNGYWLLRKNVPQAYENVQDLATAAADLWHLRNVPDTAVIAGAFELTGATQQIGAVENNVPSSSSEWVYFVRPVASAAAFASGEWSLQLDLIEMTANEGGLSLHDIRVQRYSSTGGLLETRYLHQGELMTLPAGATRVSVTEQLTGWSSGSADDLLALSFRFQNDNTDASELYVVRVGVQHSDWGGSWLSQPR